MWDQSQLKLALGATAQTAPVTGEAKSVAASTDVAEAADLGEQGSPELSKLRQKAPAGDLQEPGDTNGTQMKSLEQTNSELLAELESLRTLLAGKEQAARDAEERAQLYEEKHNAVASENAALIAEKNRMVKDMEAKDEEIMALKARMPSMEKELDDLKARNLELAASFSKLSKTKVEVESRSEMLRQSKEASDEALKKMTDRLREMQKERDFLSSSLEESQTAAKNHSAELEKVRAELKAVREAKSKGPKELEDQVANLANQVCSVEQLLLATKHENAGLEARLVEYQQADRDNMFVGILGGAASTLVVGGLCQLCLWSFRK